MNASAGQGRLFHRFKCVGNPLPSFEGEPKLVEIPSDIDEFTDLLWKSLNQDNKVSLFVRFIDIMLAIPNLLLTIVVVSILEPSLTNATLAIAVVSIPSYVRLTRAAVINEKNRDYVTSSRVAGASVLRLMFIVILPNCLAPLIVQMTMGISNAILELATLGFLGIGAKPTTPEMNTMISK